MSKTAKADTSAQWDGFGTMVGGSRWFNDAPDTVRVPVRSYRERWFCPCMGCDGEMVFNGMSWPVNPPGYHHTCTRCAFTAAIRGARYPRVIHVEGDE